jgi:hypothetical protein
MMKWLIPFFLVTMWLNAGCTPEPKSTVSPSAADTKSPISQEFPSPSLSSSISGNKKGGSLPQQDDKLIGDPHYINAEFGWEQTDSG